MNVHVLSGCVTEPLINYLKAMGVLRILGEQRDKGARGYWQGQTFVLTTEFSADELIEFFIDDYMPTPILAPWNGGSGFYGTEKRAAVRCLQAVETGNERVADYIEAIKTCRAIIDQLDADDKEGKAKMLAACRSKLPDKAVQAMDALYVLTTDRSGKSAVQKPSFAPLFGTGGNDGNLEFTNTFMQYLQLVIKINDKPSRQQAKELKLSRDRLQCALFADCNPPLIKGSVGQFFPGSGGPNATIGFSDDSVLNPWDYVLAMEGLLLYAGSATRRLASTAFGRAAFPFCVSASAAGWGTLQENDADKESRGEVWLPLWRRPARVTELKHLFSEGRMQINTKRATTGVDVVRAIASLGVDRGIDEFHRMGFIAGSRFGKMYLAVSLGSYPVKARPEARLVDEIDHWLGQLRRYAKSTDASSLRSCVRTIEDAVFALCQHGSSRRVQDLLSAMGRASQTMARRQDTFNKDKNDVQPLRLLADWIQQADDGSAEFRIAAAVASIRGNDKVGHIRELIEPVLWDKKQRRYQWNDHPCWSKITDLPRTFSSVLSRRLQQSRDFAKAPTKDHTSVLLWGRLAVDRADISLLLTGGVDEHRVMDLLSGLVAVDYKDKMSFQPRAIDREPIIDRGYAALKLLFLPYSLEFPRGAQPVAIRPETSVVRLLSAHRCDEAVRLALRRLRSSGFKPLVRNMSMLRTKATEQRLAPALLVPMSDINYLASYILQQPEQGKE